MGRRLIGGLMATIAVMAAIGASSAFAVAARTPAYITERRMMALIQEKGIVQSGVNRTVLDVVCQGAGLPRGQFPYQRYHIFECYITTARARFVQYRVTVTQDANYIYWNYARVPGF